MSKDDGKWRGEGQDKRESKTRLGPEEKLKNVVTLYSCKKDAQKDGIHSGREENGSKINRKGEI